MNPDILMVDADHDMRNPADMLVLNAISRNVMHTEGIAMVQNITRPLGIPIQHSSIPFQTSIQGQTTNMNLPFQRDQLANQLKTIDATNASIDILEKQYQLSLEQTKLTQDSAAKSQAPTRNHRRTARQHRELRRRVPAVAQLLLLGTALLRHPAVRRDSSPCSIPSTGSTK